jgi:hypothetical protein
LFWHGIIRGKDQLCWLAKEENDLIKINREEKIMP